MTLPSLEESRIGNWNRTVFGILARVVFGKQSGLSVWVELTSITSGGVPISSGGKLVVMLRSQVMPLMVSKYPNQGKTEHWQYRAGKRYL
ncbi:MAG: hypothetical protein ACYTX0_22140 [Nostoc sp.]